MKQLCWIPQLIHLSGVERLKAAGFEPLMGVDEPSAEDKKNIYGAIFRDGTFTRTMMEQYPKLKVIGVHGVGTDGIDIEAASDLGIVVFNTPGINTRSVAEHTLALLFTLSKKLISAQAYIRNDNYLTGRYDRGRRELYGQTLGLVGFGAIAQATARLAAAIGMKILVCSRQSAAAIEAEGYSKAEDLNDLLSRADMVSLHVASVPETYHLIDGEALQRMKPTACLINTGRGALVDPQALATALAEGTIAGAALDVFEQEPLPVSDPLLDAPNLIVTPHIGGSTEDALINLACTVTSGVIGSISGTQPTSMINAQVWNSRRI